MCERPPIPERLSSLLQTGRRDALNRHQQRAVSAASDLSRMSIDSATSDFFDAKVKAWESEVDYIRCIRDGLDEAKTAKLLSDSEFQKELEPFLEPFRTASSNLKVLKRQRQLLLEDLEEQVEVKKHRSHEPGQDFFERAYAETIVPRVMAARAKQKHQPFDQSAFKKSVYSYYGIEELEDHSAWCHVLGGWYPCRSVKAAHLVPKSLTKEEVSHLFGAGEVVLSDPRNGITLLHTIEDALDSGAIVIMPIPGETTVPTRWKCILIDETRKKNIVWRRPDGTVIKFADIDNTELKFLTDNRPRRRYLYFRFVVSYLNAKRNNYWGFTSKVETGRFWPTLGPYLRRSTLVALGRCISGTELPQSLIEGNTFESEYDAAQDKDSGMILGADIREALEESIKEHARNECYDEESEEEL
ncbi:hypothetical protein ASPZODRAFT_162606 [Penicilliopsis zonata CBS 506.65]|uniref:HNH nuclease domain-containing protein n=1 Tax=Penicilliopsis zonata CBS 506.65 TaxID=1073090 RepID=A0A1L9SU68_9EURO|nr:hypothetical protein ASPZODRAFT_162606 [Penicilliopsis zonata CBS 506.65]OJJ50661.1 hypothetical protein ASPZODRAFT_162606 [Penicilliopsis zonata CBS 506.65]